MARRIENTKSYRRRRLATRIRAIKAELRKGNCYYAEQMFLEINLRSELDKYSVSLGQATYRSLQGRINRCHRKHGEWGY